MLSLVVVSVVAGAVPAWQCAVGTVRELDVTDVGGLLYVGLAEFMALSHVTLPVKRRWAARGYRRLAGGEVIAGELPRPHALRTPRKCTPATPCADDSWIPTVTPRLGRGCAKAYAVMGGPDEAIRCLAEARGEHHRRDRTQAELLLAEVHVRAGEPCGLTLAREAIGKVSTLQSVTARGQRLVPLATALDARPGSDTRELARRARQIATTRI